MNTSHYDGFYFLPNNEDRLTLSFFEFDGEYGNGKKINSNNILGDIWQVAFFKKDDSNKPLFDDSFEAIIGSPESYIMSLSGAGLYGCIVRKTDKSMKWFNNYIEGLRGVK